MKIKNITLWILAMVCFVNLPLWDFFTKPEYTYRNASGSFWFAEETYDNLITAERAYGYFLGTHTGSDTGDNRLFRTFRIAPWEFWQWRQFVLNSDRFKLPFKPIRDKHP